VDRTLGWPYNVTPSEPSREPELDAKFPEIVLHAASRLLPRLKAYIGALPRDRSHYGGYYPMTAENWPLIGAAQIPGVFLAAALSDYGTLSACATGNLCARAIARTPVPAFAKSLAPSRYQDRKPQLESAASRGLL
jgi:D-arginine dehydrogenase